MPLTGSNERMMMMLKFQLDQHTYNSLSAYMDALKVLMTEAESRVEALENLMVAIDASVFGETVNTDEHIDLMAYVHECVELWKRQEPETTIVQ